MKNSLIRRVSKPNIRLRTVRHISFAVEMQQLCLIVVNRQRIWVLYLIPCHLYIPLVTLTAPQLKFFYCCLTHTTVRRLLQLRLPHLVALHMKIVSAVSLNYCPILLTYITLEVNKSRSSPCWYLSLRERCLSMFETIEPPNNETASRYQKSERTCC